MAWAEVSRSAPCTICGAAKWCMRTDDGALALCNRSDGHGAIKQAPSGGWIYRLGDQPGETVLLRRRLAIRLQEEEVEFEDIVRRGVKATSDAQVRRCARQLGLPDPSGLISLRAFWSRQRRSWGFPMVDEACNVVGIRYRTASGRKFAEKGSRNGLFVPQRRESTGPVLICEGPTDCAALLTLGFHAIGRASCSTGAEWVARVVAGREAVVVADGDAPGRRGAETLAARLVLACPVVRMIEPPPGTKDARAWVRAGGRREDVEVAIAAAEPWRVALRGAR